MTPLEEYCACMERLQRGHEALAALLDKPRQIDRLGDEAMRDLDYACEWLEIALEHIQRELKQ